MVVSQPYLKLFFHSPTEKKKFMVLSLSSEFPAFFLVHFLFYCFLFIGFCNFTLSSMSKSWLCLVVLKWSPQHLSIKKSISIAVCDNQVGFRCRNWMFGVGQEGRVSRDSPKEGTLFFFPIYTLSEVYGILGLPIEVAPLYKMGSCWLCGSRMWHFQQQFVLHSRPIIAAGRVKNQHCIAWSPTSQDSSLFTEKF